MTDRLPMRGNARPLLASAILVLLTVVGWVVLARSHGAPDREVLASLFALHPGIEGRLVGDLQGRSAKSLADAPQAISLLPKEQRQISRGSLTIRQRAAAEPDPANLHDLALLHLAQGHFDEAILTLESVLAASPGDARPANDLAAAYLTRAEAQGRAFDLILALDAAQRAVAADPHLPQALYNRAQALARLHLKGQATSAWAAFLETEPSPEWRDEAQRQLDELARPTLEEDWQQAWPRLQSAMLRRDAAAVRSLVARFPNQVRLRAEEELLPAWGSTRERGDLTQAAAQLDAIRQLAHAVREVTGDAMVQNAMAVIDQAAAAGNRMLLARLAAGHATYGRGIALYRTQQLDRALPLLEAAGRDLYAAGSPMASTAELYTGICVHYADTSQAALQLADLRRRVNARVYPVLAGQVEWMLGTVDNNQGRPERALHHFGSALALLAPAIGLQGAAPIHVLRAETFHRLGYDDEAWQERRAAFAGNSRLGDRRRLHSALYEAAHALVGQGAASLALDLLAELLENDLAWGREGALAETHLLRGQALDLLGRGDEALAAFRAAKVNADAIGAGPLRDRVIAELSLAEGEGLATREPAQAVDSLSATLESDQGQGFLFQITRVLTARARAYHALGDLDQAEADLRRAIAEHERVREGVGDDQLRLSYFERAQEAFDEMITLQLDDRRNGSAAFDFAERARSRLLLDLTLGEPGKGASLPQALTGQAIRGRLPRGVALVQYAVLPDRLVAWVVTPDQEPLPVALPAAPATAARQVRALQTAMRRRAEEREIRNVAATLFDVLFRPLLPFLPSDSAVVFVPDRFLAEVSFASLFDAGRRRYLIEDRAVAVAPSATLYLTAVERSSRFPRSAPWSTLAVGDPGFDRERHPRLPRLPEAAAEAAEVANLHPGSEVLLGAAADREAVLAAAGRHRVFHFAGHALLDAAQPSRSRLVLAAGIEETSGDLYASDLARLRLPETELVVLSACHTAGDSAGGRENLTGIAAAFLAAGPAVLVGSQWDVEDRPTRELMLAFHRALPQAEDPAAALRTAQLQLLRNPDPVLRSPASWAGFEAIGGSIPTRTFHGKED